MSFKGGGYPGSTTGPNLKEPTVALAMLAYYLPFCPLSLHFLHVCPGAAESGLVLQLLSQSLFSKQANFYLLTMVLHKE